MNDQRNPIMGSMYALLAFTSWGLLPIYWKALDTVPALEILSHRMIWSTLFITIVILILRKWSEVLTAFKSLKTIKILTLSTLLLAGNWWVYIWAVNHGHVLQTSMGYFINPLLNIVLGMIFFKEKLRPGQIVASLFALSGVLFLTITYGQVPWIALALACSFSVYGLLRKMVDVSGATGFCIETFILGLPAIGYIVFIERKGMGSLFLPDLSLLLVGAGFVTAFPLVWFANAAKKLKLSTLGFFQYLAPSIQFFLAVFIYQENFTNEHAVTFGLIWIGLLIYSSESLFSMARQQLSLKKSRVKCLAIKKALKCK